MKHRRSVMSRMYKAMLSTIFILMIFSTVTFISGVFPDTAQAAVSDILNKLPESKPGNLLIKWYTAKRYISGQEPAENSTRNIGRTYDRWLVNAVWPPVNKDISNTALENYDTSVFLAKDLKSDLTLDMTRWQPDPEYWITFQDPEVNDDNWFKSIYNWNWYEVNGFIKLPKLPDSVYGSVGINPLQRSDIQYNLEITGNGRFIHGDRFVPFRLRIKCPVPDKSSLNATIPIVFYYKYYMFEGWNGFIEHSKIIPSQNLYGSLELKDMKSFFQLDAQNYSLTLNPDCRAFPVEAYEYGYAGGTVFKPLALGANYLEPDGGDVIVRYKSPPHLSVTVGNVAKSVKSYLMITGRTPATVSLEWSAPSGGAVPASYDIYRQKVDQMKGFSSNPVFTVDNTVPKVGSTTGLTFTDRGLGYDVVYAYYVKANYPAGNSSLSNTARTDSVTMEGLPSIPNNLKVSLVSQNTKADLKLSWDASSSKSGIKEYVVYRKITRDSAPSQGTGGVIILGDISESIPVKIAQTTDLSFLDRNLGFTDKCEYYVQAIDKNGIPSYISPPLEVPVEKLIAPVFMIPDTLEIYNGETCNFAVTFNSAYTGDRSGTWSIADGTIASVEENNIAPIKVNPKHTIPGSIGAKVTGKRPGVTTLIFKNTVTGLRQYCRVAVKPAFTIAPDQLSLYTGDTGSLTVAFDDGYTGSRGGKWVVDDNAVASIDQNGVVTGIKAGTAIATYVLNPVPVAPAVRIGGAAGNGAAVAVTESAKPFYNIVRNVPVIVKQGAFTVSFDTMGGSPIPASIAVRHDSTVARPADPSYRDFAFVGWYTVPNGGFRWDFANDKVTADITLYACWAAKAVPVIPDAPVPVFTMPAITGPGTINLLEGYVSTGQAFSFGGYPAPSCGISPTQPNTANATFSGMTLTVPAGLTATGSPYNVTLFATNPVGTVTKTITVNVSQADTLPTITGPDTINLLEGYVSTGQAFSLGGYPAPSCGISPTQPNTANATFSGVTLTVPAGLATTGSPYSVTLTATNRAGTVTKTVNVNVYPQIQINFVSQIDVILSRNDNKISAFGGAGGPYTFTLAPGSSMPGGLTLNADGTITGTAAVGSSYPPVTVIIRDAVGNTKTTVPMAVVVVN